jgi:hypothetical protein
MSKKDQEAVVEPVVFGIVPETPKQEVNPGYVRIQNLQAVEQTIPLVDGGEPLKMSPFRGKHNTSRPVLLKNLPAAFVERLIKEKKIRKVV